MKNLLALGLTAACLAIATSGVAFSGDDVRGCNVATLKGTYVFAASGHVINPVSGAAQPKALVEVIEFKGDGTAVFPTATRSVNGTIAQNLSTVGTYTVGEDCVGTLTIDGPTFDMFISPRGNQLWMIQTNPGSVFEGSATRTSTGPRENPR
jgi:hypothetical protein